MNLTDVNNYLLVQNNLQHNDLLYLLNIISSSQMDYGDIYFQLKFHESWILEDNIVKSGSYNSLQGAGIRVITGEQTGFAYTNNLTFDSLTRTAIAAKSIKNTDYDNTSSINRKKIILSNHQPISIYSQDNPILSTSNEEKIELLMQINKIARITDARVKKVVARLSSTYEYILVISTDGILATDVRPLTKLSIVVQVEHNGKREQGFGGGGGRFGCEFFQEKIMGESRVEKWTRDAVNMGIVNLFSVEAPAGLMPVILGPGWPGILIHEAIGHGLEGDFNRCKTSIFFDKLGTRVASDLCTIVDDATYAGLRGSLNIDDEGVSGQCTVLIQNGILKRYMQDKLNSRLMNEFSTGNGRRESYAHLPMPRMTNTYMLAGKTTPEEIIDSVDYGIYAPNFGGGQVDITSGKFVFSIIEAYLIENGRMTKPIKGATLIGSGMEVMQNISMVGNNLLLDNGSGTCIKYGQGIPVSVGQPTIKLDKITVGGTN